VKRVILPFLFLFFRMENEPPFYCRRFSTLRVASSLQGLGVSWWPPKNFPWSFLFVNPSRTLQPLFPWPLATRWFCAQFFANGCHPYYPKQPIGRSPLTDSMSVQEIVVPPPAASSKCFSLLAAFVTGIQYSPAFAPPCLRCAIRVVVLHP